MTNKKERGLDFNQALWVKPVWVSLFCTFVSCGQSDTKTTWNKTFVEMTRNSWENQLLLHPGGSFNRTNLKCKITNSYLQPTGSEERIEYGLWKEGGKNPLYFSFFGVGGEWNANLLLFEHFPKCNSWCWRSHAVSTVTVPLPFVVSNLTDRRGGGAAWVSYGRSFETSIVLQCCKNASFAYKSNNQSLVRIG